MQNSITFREYIGKISVKENSVVAIGNFDGLHLGHMKLIDRAVELAEQEDLLSIVFSYEVHPKHVLYRKLVYLIMPAEEKERILSEKGIFMILHAPFDETLRNQTAYEFCDEVLIKILKIKYLILGEDARFGKEMMSASEIKKYLNQKGVEVELIPLLKINGERISSSKIRNYIEKGEIEKAAQYLGRPFELTGRVIHGKKRGKTDLGFPTANLDLIKDQAIPAKGVYQTLVEHKGKIYHGATSVGNNPTFGENPLTVETYILDFDKVIYGQKINIKFIRRLRDEIRFDSSDELIEQMNRDIKRIRENN